MTEHVDLMVIGGGLSGLSLVRRLAASGYPGRVCIVEPRLRYEDDRSWAFWTPSGSEWSACATCTWDRWLFSRQAGPALVQRAEGWRYAYVRSIDFYQGALRAIEASPNITLMPGSQAGAIENLGDKLGVVTSAGTFSARYVVDTRPPLAAQWSGATLFQCFAGRELRLRKPGFDDQQVELMTDMRSDPRGFVFSYVLALSPTSALVEVTRFSRRPIGAAELATDLDALLETRGWSGGEVLRAESAVLPMGLPAAADVPVLRGVAHAGIGAGALRAASGYGFLRIQAWADRCADALLRGLAPVGHPPEPRLRGWMDQAFLRALARHPERTPEFFFRLASLVPGPAFVRFMSDQAGWADNARIIAALPPGPFLGALQGRARLARLPA